MNTINMNREIKFRAWDRHNRCFVEPYAFWILNGHIWEKNSYGETQLADEWLDIQQFTGVKDKNGKEIYEGDIVRVKRAKKLYKNTPEDWVCDVRFHDGMFAFAYQTVEMTASIWTCEVIGNIYENPDMLDPSYPSFH